MFYAARISRGKLGKASYVEKWVSTITPLTAGETTFNITFDWHESMDVPGAFIIKNYHRSQFYLKTVTLDVPGHGGVHFVCNSWVYPTHRYRYNRVFFSNKVLIVSENKILTNISFQRVDISNIYNFSYNKYYLCFI